MSSSTCSDNPNPCGSRSCVLCESCAEGFTCEDMQTSGDSDSEGISPQVIGGVCAAGGAIIILLLAFIIIGLVLLWRRRSDALTLTIQGEQRERYTYQSYYKTSSQDFANERRRSRKSGSYNPTFEMHKVTNMFLPFSEEQLEADFRSSVLVDPTTNVDGDDEALEDGFLNETTTTHVTYSTDQPVVPNVQLLNQSVIPTATTYENLAVDDDIDINQEDFMTKENFQELERKRFSVIKKWTSSNKGVLEITPDLEL